MTDLDGEIFQHLEYFPFGETWVEEHSNTQRTPYLFTAKELDEETGLYYFGARYYDPRTSIWQSPDPILGAYMKGQGSDGGVFLPPNINLYGYSQQRPTRLIDPNGAESQDAHTAWNLLDFFGIGGIVEGETAAINAGLQAVADGDIGSAEAEMNAARQQAIQNNANAMRDGAPLALAMSVLPGTVKPKLGGLGRVLGLGWRRSTRQLASTRADEVAGVMRANNVDPDDTTGMVAVFIAPDGRVFPGMNSAAAKATGSNRATTGAIIDRANNSRSACGGYGANCAEVDALQQALDFYDGDMSKLEGGSISAVQVGGRIKDGSFSPHGTVREGCSSCGDFIPGLGVVFD